MAHSQLVDALVLVATWAREQGPLAQRAKLTGRAILKGLGRSAIGRSSSIVHAEDEALIDCVYAMRLRLAVHARPQRRAARRHRVPHADRGCGSRPHPSEWPCIERTAIRN